MTGIDSAQTTPPGWFPDPSGEQRMRWWDGLQWTEHVSGPTSAPSVAPPARVPDETPIGNVFIWLIVLLPIISIVTTLMMDYRALAIQSLSGATSGGMNSFAIYSNPQYLLSTLASWVLIAASGVLAYFDSRKLKRDGVVRPFPWGWGFLAPVYVIGRSVIVRRRSGRGLAPLWAYVALWVISIVISIIKVSQMMSVIFDYVSTTTGTTT